MKYTITAIVCDRCKLDSNKHFYINPPHFTEYNNKDYCERCLKEIKLEEKGLQFCNYCDGNGKRTKINQPYWLGNEDIFGLSKSKTEEYTCEVCKGSGERPLIK